MEVDTYSSFLIVAKKDIVEKTGKTEIVSSGSWRNGWHMSYKM